MIDLIGCVIVLAFIALVVLRIKVWLDYEGPLDPNMSANDLRDQKAYWTQMAWIHKGDPVKHAEAMERVEYIQRQEIIEATRTWRP